MEAKKYISEDGVDEIVRECENDSYALIGSRCTCGFMNFPAGDFCIKCGSSRVEKVALSRTGTIYSWTRTMRPVNHMPAGNITGFIDLDDGTRLISIIDVEENDVPRIGANAEIIFRPLWEEDGIPVIGYAAKQTKE